MMKTRTNLVNSVNAKSSARRGLCFTPEELKRWHWEEGQGMAAIARRHGVSVPAIEYWFKKHNVTHRSVLRELFFEASPSLSYVIGSILGDGCIYRNERIRKWHVRLHVTDEVFAQHFAAAVRLIGISCNVIKLKNRNSAWKTPYLAYACSKPFVQWWISMGPEALIALATQYPADFVRGFYEAEGTIKTHRGHLELSMCNTDERLIHAVHSSIPQRIRTSLLLSRAYHERYRPRWDICINSQLDIKRFLAWCMPCFKTQPRGQVNTEPSPARNDREGVENTKAIQTGTQVGSVEAILQEQRQAPNQG